MTTPREILDFWFFPPDDPRHGETRAIWFEGERGAFDAEIRARFGALYERARAGRLESWRERGPESCLALILVLDQFPRNMFRGGPRAYESDARALALAREAIARGFDRALAPTFRWFVYTPFEHAESLAAQRQSVRLAEAMNDAPERAAYVRAARRHYEIVARFGRFPHRNRALGRETTPEEAAFLEEPDSSF